MHYLVIFIITHNFFLTFLTLYFSFLLAGRFSTRVNYIRSPVVTWEALKLASMETAIACVIYNSAGNSDRERDSTSIYNIITVKKYRSHNQTHGIPTLIIAETVVPTNKHRLETAGADIVLCFQSMKCRLLGRSLLSPGLSTIVCNLIGLLFLLYIFFDFP